MKDNSEYASELNHKQQALTPADKLNTASDVVTNGSVPTGTSGFGAKRIATDEDNNA